MGVMMDLYNVKLYTETNTVNTQDLIKLASMHRHDHDDQSTSFFDPASGFWRIENLDPIAVGAFKSSEEASNWIHEEIAYFSSIGDGRADIYTDLIYNGIKTPVVIGVSTEGPKLWDGYHRTAIALLRGEVLPSVVGYSDPMLPSLSGGSLVFSQSELEEMDIDVLDKVAFGCKDGDIIEISPADLVIKYPGDLENPEEKYRLGGMSWVRTVSFDDPIEVSIGDDGRRYLEDGHHRRFAAIKQGRSLLAEISIKGNPVKHILDRQEKHSATLKEKHSKHKYNENDLSI